MVGSVLAINFINQKLVKKFFKCISDETNVNGNIYDFIEKFVKYKNNCKDIFEKEYFKNLCHHRDGDDEKKRNIYEKFMVIYQFSKKRTFRFG